MARTRRAKLQVATWYHLFARVTDRQFLLESDEQKAHLADLLRRTLEFSGVELGTYVIMDNHFHLFVRVPEARELDDGEILRRIAVLNGQERAGEIEEKWTAWRKSGQTARYDADRLRYLRRTRAWPLREAEFGMRVFAALGYRKDAMALTASA